MGCFRVTARQAPDKRVRRVPLWAMRACALLCEGWDGLGPYILAL